MKNSKNFVRQISESYIKMKLDEASPPGGNGVPKWYLPQPQGQPMKPRYVDWYNENQYWKAFDDYRRLERQAQPQSPNTPRPGNSPTSTTRPPLRLPTLPIPKSPLGRLGVVGAVAASAYGLGTAIDQYIVNPQGPKATPRPYQQDVLPSPESLYPAPSVSQNHTGGYGGSGSGGSGGGLGGGMGGSGR
jgi:hypothetical protein